MITNSARAIFPEWSDHYTGEVPTLEDIGRGLGRTIRFSGQTNTAYSVLCHTIVGMSIGEPEHAVHFLLHDAPEAILGDCVSTWKSSERELDEAVLLGNIYRDLGIDEPDAEQQAAVKQVDIACLAAEAHALGHAAAEKYWPKESFSELEESAFALTINLLQQGAVGQFMDGVVAGRLYRQLFEQASDPEGFEERQKIKAMLK